MIKYYCGLVLQVSKGKVELRGCLVQSHSKLTLFILQVGWVERSETQHNPYDPLHNPWLKILKISTGLTG